MAKKVPIALQLYSTRGECKDLPNALKQVAALGYAGAEPWGYGGDTLEWQGHTAKDIRGMYDDNGLTCCGLHLQTQALVGDNLRRTIEWSETLGNRFLIIAADKPRMSSPAGIQELAGILDRAAEALKPRGMYAGYHAHGFDFAQVQGKPAWDHLFGKVRPDVIMQMDVGNCMSGGGDPVATLERYPGRARTVHLKDFGGPAGSVIGEGTADWKNVFRLCDTLHPVEWYVVEEGGEGGHGFEVPKRSLEALRRMGR